MKYCRCFLLCLLLGLVSLGGACAPASASREGEQMQEATDEPLFHYDPDEPTHEPF